MTAFDPELAALRRQLAEAHRMIKSIDTRLTQLDIVERQIGAIARATAHIFGVEPADLLGGTRRGGALIEARFAAYWVARHATSNSLPQIGRYMGRRDHTTIMHGIVRAEEMRAADASYRQITDALVNRVRQVDVYA